ncbi:hypothetical protein O181_044595 [Austropuccinia psidii MF-1]|uniref:Integrase catalytic domain-containing protein n=1 Tax=Austropuccinia psidii MF-1 TaxID=1389203 RepID=A0A9Q3HKB3_9BASI|nr:hypothetical protein [Austropuccinia psidii MF-1]
MLTPGTRDLVMSAKLLSNQWAYLQQISLERPVTSTKLINYLLKITLTTSFKIVQFLKNKSDSFRQFAVTKKLMETQHKCLLKKLVSDQGEEFLNSHFQQLVDECGFIHSFSPAHTTEHNGFSERANHAILKKTQCMLNSTKLPNSHWAEELPYTLWTGLPPIIKKLQVFSFQAIVMTPKEHRDSKLGPTRVEGILLVFPQLKQQGNDLLPLNLSWETLDEPLSEPQLSPTVDLTPDTQELVDEPQVPMSHDSMSELALVDETQLDENPALTY